MTTLTEFLLARIAEEEAVAERAGSFTPWTEPFQHDNYGHLTIQPARVLQECEAKRKIVEAHPLVTERSRLAAVWTGPTPGVACETCGGNPVDSRALLEDIGPCDTLLALATVYSDHPDFRDEWR